MTSRPRASTCFNSRTPGGVRLEDIHNDTEPFTFQFTHPGRGATEYKTANDELHGVSIHAPREGCDKEDRGVIKDELAVSIHAPREGCDLGFLSGAIPA